MRLSESTLKAAILHPKEEFRFTATLYFSGSFSQDETIMPQVVHAVERYGRSRAIRILRETEHLPQSPATVDWLISELRQDYDLEDLADDNYRFAVALILYHARPELLLTRQAEIALLPMFPAQLRAPLQERIDMLSWGWDRGWTALEALGQDTMRRRGVTRDDVRYAHRIIESLACYRETKATAILDLLQRQYGGRNVALMGWLEPLIVSLAGAMQLESAIPLLIERLDDKNVRVADESITALIRIGTDVAVQAIADQWLNSDTGDRAAAADVLKHIHTDLCAESCLRFFTAEKDTFTRMSLAYAVLSQFIEEGVEPVRQLVLGHDEVTPNGIDDIRYRLVAACTIMGVFFPEYERWYKDAVANNWGLGDYTPPRLADSFRPDQPARRDRGTGRGIGGCNEFATPTTVLFGIRRQDQHHVGHDRHRLLR